MSAQRSVREVMAKYKKPPAPKIDLDVAATCHMLFRQFEGESTVHSWIQESTCCFEEILFSLYLWHALSPRKKENIESRLHRHCAECASTIFSLRAITSRGCHPWTFPPHAARAYVDWQGLMCGNAASRRSQRLRMCLTCALNMCKFLGKQVCEELSPMFVSMGHSEDTCKERIIHRSCGSSTGGWLSWIPAQLQDIPDISGHHFLNCISFHHFSSWERLLPERMPWQGSQASTSFLECSTCAERICNASLMSMRKETIYYKRR